MASGQSYPSPNAAQVSGGAGPFYGQNGGHSPPQDVPEDLKLLRDDIARSTAPVAPMLGNYEQHQNEQLNHNVVNYQIPGSHQDQLRVPTPTNPDIQQGHMGHDGMRVAGQEYASPPENETANGRKRSKVSRACDECRRKKIRCDATSENGPEACSSCKRTSTPCRFSRQPMKRGPSKGYIKELADRISGLEKERLREAELRVQQAARFHQSPLAATDELPFLHGMADDGLPDGLAHLQNYSPAVQPPFSRKRNYSHSDGLQDAFTTPQRSGWQPNEFGVQISPYDPHAYQGRPENFGHYEGSNERAQLNPHVVEEYYRIIHPTLPFLPVNKQTLASTLASVPKSLRDAFNSALECVIRLNPASTMYQDIASRPNPVAAVRSLNAYEREDTPEQLFTTALVHVQTLILLTLLHESDSQTQDIPEPDWLGQAIAIARGLKLNIIDDRALMLKGNLDAEAKLKRRVFWVLFILDRWHACGTAKWVQIPDNGAVLIFEDRENLGEPMYQLASISSIMGHLAASFTHFTSHSNGEMSWYPTNHTEHLIGMFAQGEIKCLREHMTSASPLVDIALIHLRLLVTRLVPSSGPGDLVALVMAQVHQFNLPDAPLTPLNHHFVAMTYLCLAELADSEMPDLRKAAVRGFADLEVALHSNRALAKRDDGEGWETILRELVSRKQSQLGSGAPIAPMLGLEHLATAAVNEREGETSTADGGRPESSSGHNNIAAAAAAAANLAQAAQAEMAPAFEAGSLARCGYLGLVAKAAAAAST